MKKKKIILDLCGGTGSWSLPYKNSGYKVITITLPNYDIRKTKIKDGHICFVGNEKSHLVVAKEIYGILAAPPCTMFSFARTNAKKPRDLEEGMECVRACLDIIWKVMEIKQDTKKKTLPLKFWALENPYFGFLKNFLGKPAFVFDPWEFGDGYKKRTALWGAFSEPVKSHKNQEEVLTKEQIEKHKTNSQKLPKFDYMKSKDIHPEAFGVWDKQARRSITPAGFAKAFFESNL